MKIKNVEVHNYRAIKRLKVNFNDYGLIVGANNAGKSTLINSLRAFYEKEGFKFSKDRDFPKMGGLEDNESWIDIEFDLDDDEFESLMDDYKWKDNVLKVRKYFLTSQKGDNNKTMAGSIFGYTDEETLSGSPFYGAKNVGSGKFGNLIYIPAISRVEDHTRLTGPSHLRELLDNLLKDVVEDSETFSKFSGNFENLSSELKNDTTDDGRSLLGFEHEINSHLKEWGAEFKLDIRPPSTADIIKNLVSHNLFESGSEEPQGAGQFGSGFQRHFIFSLIQVGAKLEVKKTKKDTKEFSPAMDLILFEEPEAFLHPPQQDILASRLMELAKRENRQIICTSHSSHFVSRNMQELTSIVRLSKKTGEIKSFQIDQKRFEEISKGNEKLLSILREHSKNSEEETEFNLATNSFNLYLFLDSERSSLFFANFILLVEGPSERSLVSKLIYDKKIDPKDIELKVLDTFGKYNTHRFIELLNELGIPHAVLIDSDENKNIHKDLNELISNCENQQCTKKVTFLEKDLESFLEVKTKSTHGNKAQHLMYLYSKDEISSDKLTEFGEVIEKVLPSSTS
ncbi:MAG: AAA family ATPase [Bdellovibrionota bacterium]|nr:AAA family ATPase [Bdellovibrionota bacterium]